MNRIARHDMTSSLTADVRPPAARGARHLRSFMRHRVNATLAGAGILGTVAVAAVLFGNSLPASATGSPRGAVGVPPAGVSSDARSTIGPIVGTWVVDVTPHGVPLAPFQSTLSDTPGGVVIEAASNPLHTPAGQVTDSTEGLGVWSMSGSSTVHIRFHKYNFDADGNYTGQTTIVEADTLDRDADTYKGMATVTVRSPSGAILRQFTASSHGTRMQP